MKIKKQVYENKIKKIYINFLTRYTFSLVTFSYHINLVCHITPSPSHSPIPYPFPSPMPSLSSPSPRFLVYVYII